MMTDVKKVIEQIEAWPDNSQVYCHERHGDIEEYEPIDIADLKAVVAHLSAVEAERARYREALERYGREVSWFSPKAGFGNITFSGSINGYDIAKAALAGKENDDQITPTA